MRYAQPDYVSNASFPAQYWSGPSQNGTGKLFLDTHCPLVEVGSFFSFYGGTNVYS